MRDEAAGLVHAYPRQMAAGVAVEVRSSSDGDWSRGFDVSEVVLGAVGVDGYRLRRVSDGSVLPVVFPADDIIPSGR
jgi:hypothetical protein